MNPRGTFERVYEAIRRQLEAAAFAPGDHLEPAHLADELNSSITPVRDALQRLVGERLVEASPGDGFRLPLLTEVGLRQLYEWNSQLLQMALKRAGPWPCGQEPDAATGTGEGSEPIVRRTEALFAAIVRQSGNAEHLTAIHSASSRLSMVRHREAGLIGDLPGELQTLEQATGAGDVAGLRRLLLRYHRRRQQLADRLVVAMQVR